MSSATYSINDENCIGVQFYTSDGGWADLAISFNTGYLYYRDYVHFNWKRVEGVGI